MLGLGLSSLCIAGVDTPHVNEQDVYFGEALYYALQGDYVDAITRRDIAFGRLWNEKHKPDPLNVRFGNTQLSVGEFEVSYRMYQRAGRAMKAIFEGSSDQLVRNEAAYRLARIFLQMGEPVNALKCIELISGKIPDAIHDGELSLRAQIYMANGKFADAVQPLQELQDSKSYKGFASYNLGVASIKTGQEKQGISQLDKAGKISGDDEVTLAIKDKANLTLGYRLLDSSQPAKSKQYFERVRLSGPFSNRALLGAGWADVAQGDFESALAPWSALSKRSLDDKPVQESMLGVAYAYAKLNLPGKASVLYGKALEEFGKELSRLDASIKSAREGEFLKMLQRQDWKQDKDWVAKIKGMPEAPETRYLLNLMESRDFEELLRNYLDLDDLLKRLKSWDERLNSLMGLRHSAAQQGYDDQVRQLKNRVHDSMQKVNNLMIKQGQMLETMAVEELGRRRNQLQGYQDHARVAWVDSYERASNMQAPSSGGK